MNNIEKLLLNIVDETWNECTESTEVPSTDLALRIISRANVDNIKLIEEKECCWTRVDEGVMGFRDYVYKTSCGKSHDVDKLGDLSLNFCFTCGSKIIRK